MTKTQKKLFGLKKLSPHQSGIFFTSKTLLTKLFNIVEIKLSRHCEPHSGAAIYLQDCFTPFAMTKFNILTVKADLFPNHLILLLHSVIDHVAD